MIRPLLPVSCALLALLLSPLCPVATAADQKDPQAVDAIAAVVNGEVITQSQIRMLMGPRERLLRSQFRGEEMQKQLKQAREAALKDLIDRQLIVQSFKKEEFSIPDYYVEQRIDEIIRENFGGDRNTFIKTLQAQNYTLSEFKKDEREKIIVAAMRGKKVKPTTMASPNKIDEYYRTHRDEFTAKEEVKLRMIMIPSRGSDSASSQKALAEEILGKVAGGADFERMAQMYSEDSTRDVGGDWGWVERKTLAPQLEKVAFSLKKGKVSNIIELGGNYYIIKVDDRRGGETKSLTEARTDIEKKLIQLESQRLQENWIAGLRQKATIRTF